MLREEDVCAVLIRNSADPERIQWDNLREGEFTMESRNEDSSGPAIALALLGGAIVGFITGILVAPKSGVETRRTIREYADKTEDEVIEKAKEARAALDEMIERGEGFIAEKKADVEAAVRAGKEAMKERMEKML